MSLSPEDADNIRNLIGNCYQSILGSHEERKATICEQIKAIQANYDLDPGVMFDIVLSSIDYKAR